jgi:hypothetical protein
MIYANRWNDQDADNPEHQVLDGDNISTHK